LDLGGGRRQVTPGRYPGSLGGLPMSSLTTEYREENERQALEQAIADVADLRQLAQDAPAGTVLDACERLALDWGACYAPGASTTELSRAALLRVTCAHFPSPRVRKVLVLPLLPTVTV